jgi:hypothetical protein
MYLFHKKKDPAGCRIQKKSYKRGLWKREKKGCPLHVSILSLKYEQTMNKGLRFY